MHTNTLGENINDKRIANQHQPRLRASVSSMQTVIPWMTISRMSSIWSKLAQAFEGPNMNIAAAQFDGKDIHRVYD
ncbi:MAG: hypothetical protein AAB176_07110 [Pseudomonadota bacterium]